MSDRDEGEPLSVVKDRVIQAVDGALDEWFEEQPDWEERPTEWWLPRVNALTRDAAIVVSEIEEVNGEEPVWEDEGDGSDDAALYGRFGASLASAALLAAAAMSHFERRQQQWEAQGAPRRSAALARSGRS